MTRTWEDNCKAINGLWPHCEWTDEQRSLWRDDLSHLDQDVLHEALREVKRTHDSLYPQLPWVIEAYRSIVASKRCTTGDSSWLRETRKAVHIDEKNSARLASEFRNLIEVAKPEDFHDIEKRILDKVYDLEIVMAPATRVLAYAGQRLLGENTPMENEL